MQGFDTTAPKIYKRNSFYFWLCVVSEFIGIYLIIWKVLDLISREHFLENIFDILSLSVSIIWTFKILIDKRYLLEGNLWKKSIIYPILALQNLVYLALAIGGHKMSESISSYMISVVVYIVWYVLQVNWKAWRPYRIDEFTSIYVHPAEVKT